MCKENRREGEKLSILPLSAKKKKKEGFPRRRKEWLSTGHKLKGAKIPKGNAEKVPTRKSGT